MAEESKNFNNKNFLIMIRSKYILQKVMNNLSHKLLLKIICYNNNIKKKLNKDINDFKKEYFKIEIELIPSINKYDFKNKYNKFINLQKKYESYYHIYFNDDKKEIKTKKIKYEDKITKIKIIIDYKAKFLLKLFKNCKCLKEINFIKCNRDDIINMDYMFANCSSLEKLNISKFNMDKVTDMSYMFIGCSNLVQLDLPNFKENNILNNMSYMFCGCKYLKEINLSNFIISNTTNMDHMFCQCESLKVLNLSNFIANNIIKMDYIFKECIKLEKSESFRF